MQRLRGKDLNVFHFASLHVYLLSDNRFIYTTETAMEITSHKIIANWQPRPKSGNPFSFPVNQLHLIKWTEVN